MNIWEQYAEEKKKLQDLPPEEYEKLVKELCVRLGI